MKKVGDITHSKSGIVVPFYLDGTTFRCTAMEQPFSAPDAKVLESQVKDFLEHWLTLDWHPIICVEATDNDGWGSSKRTGLWIQPERMYLSRSPAGNILRCEWDIEPIHRKATARSLAERDLKLSSLPLGAPLKIGKTKTWMDYTEAKWEALAAMLAGIDQLSAALFKLITTTEGNARLESYRLPNLLPEQ